jgi:ABC-2 type transport system ATP-binding protein
VGLTEQAGQRLASLSGGQHRRLDVAVGLVGRPELLVLDEPTAGFDPRSRRDFHDLVHRLTDLEDTTILLTTHDLAEAEQLADRILILAEGRIVADLEVRRASLEDTYMAIAHRHERAELEEVSAR